MARSQEVGWYAREADLVAAVSPVVGREAGIIIEKRRSGQMIGHQR